MSLVLADRYLRVLTVLDDLGKGKSLTRACDDNNLTVSTFKSMLEDDEDLKRYYSDMEQRGFDALADVLLDIRTHRYYGSNDPKEQKVLSDNIKWLLARRRPLQFGDRMTVDHTHTITADRAIVDALVRGRERAENAVIDITPVVTETVQQITDDSWLKDFL